MRAITSHIKKLTLLGKEELVNESKELGAPLELVTWVAKEGRLPVPNFAAGGISTPADAALARSLGAEALFVGSGIFKSKNPESFANAIVEACTHYQDPKILAKCSFNLGEPMKGIEMSTLKPEERLQERGW